MNKSYISKLYSPYKFSCNIRYPKHILALLIALYHYWGNYPVLKKFNKSIDFPSTELLEATTLKPFCGDHYVARRGKIKQGEEILPRNFKIIKSMCGEGGL